MTYKSYRFESGSTVNIFGTEYFIEKLIGWGSSCAAYKVKKKLETNSNQTCLLKEYIPQGVLLRRNENNILVPDECADEPQRRKYYDGLKRFKDSVELMIKLRSDENLTNKTPDIHCIVDEGQIVELVFCEGVPYSEYKDTSLEDLFKNIISISNAVEAYHKKGYLHLDIKPENVFHINETSELVMLIDFDSIAPISSIADKNYPLYHTAGWSAFELEYQLRDEICKATDVFAIAEILFFKLFKRHSEGLERSFAGKYNFSKSEYLKGSNPALQNKLSDFFTRTLCSCSKNRLKKASDIAEELQKMIDDNLLQAPYIKDIPGDPSASFVGRDRELAEVERLLRENKYMYIRGIPGIGKRELALQYAKNHSSDSDSELRYDSIQLVECSSDNDLIAAINLEQYSDKETDRKESAKKKWEAIRKACDSNRNKVLLIFNDANKVDNEDLTLFENNLKCDRIFITNALSESKDDTIIDVKKPNLFLDKLSDDDALMLLANSAGLPGDKLSTNREDYIELIHCADNHTLWIEFAGKQIHNDAGVSGLVKKSQSIAARSIDKFHVIKELFVSKLKELHENPINTLMNLSLLPRMGIPKSFFKKYDLGISLESVNYLIKYGWIQERYGKSFDEGSDETWIVSVHPIIQNIAVDKLLFKQEKADRFLTKLSGHCDIHPNTDIIYAASGVSKILFEGVNFFGSEVFEVNSYFVTDAAAHLLETVESLYGNPDKRADYLERAIEIYCKSVPPNADKVSKAAAKLLRLFENNHNITNKGFSECFRSMLDNLSPHTIDERLIKKFMRLMINACGDVEKNNTEVDQWFKELANFMRKKYGESGIAGAYMNAGKLLTDRGYFDLAIQYLEKAREICIINGLDKGLAAIDTSFENVKSRSQIQWKDNIIHSGPPAPATYRGHIALDNKTIDEQLVVAKAEKTLRIGQVSFSKLRIPHLQVFTSHHHSKKAV